MTSARPTARREMAELANFYNERRWLSWDLLCGRVDERHPLWGYLAATGIDRAELLWFRDNPCPPDIVGVNYYATSERWLDHRTDRYPAAVRRRLPRLPACRHRDAALAGHADARHRAAAAGNLGALRTADRRHRSAYRCQPRRPDALAAGDLGRGKAGAGQRAPTYAPSRYGHCSVPSTGTAWSPNAGAITSPARLMCVLPSRGQPRWQA